MHLYITYYEASGDYRRSITSASNFDTSISPVDYLSSMVILDSVQGIEEFGLFAGLDGEQVDVTFFLRAKVNSNILPIAIMNFLGCAAYFLDILPNTRIQILIDVRVHIVLLLNSKKAQRIKPNCLAKRPGIDDKVACMENASVYNDKCQIIT